MKKNVMMFTAVLAMTAALSCTAYAQEKKVDLQIGNSQMTVNGEVSELDSPPVIVDGRTLVPVRAIVEALDGKADWDAETKTATLTNEAGDEVKLTINSKTASCNGTESELDTAPVIINERTMLPIRFVAESFGYKTDWNAEDKSIVISGGAEEKTEPETKPETKKSFDLSGLQSEYYGADKNGNDYTSFFKDPDMLGDVYLEVKDKNGNQTAVYKRVDASGSVYKNKRGDKLTVYYYVEDEAYRVVVDGVEKKTAFDESYNIVDADGNVYQFTEDGEKITVKDKKGSTVGEYSNTGEMSFPYVDADGNTAYEILARDGGYEDGFIGTDGKYVAFEENYLVSYLGSDNKIYNFKYNFLIVTDDEYNFIEDWKEDVGSMIDIYVGNDGTEYTVDGEFADSYTLKADGKTIKLTCDPEEEHNRKLFAQTEYGSDDDVYYDGNDGRVYVENGTAFTVYGKDGSIEDIIGLARYEEDYKAANGKTYVYAYDYKADKSYIKAGNETIELDMIMG